MVLRLRATQFLTCAAAAVWLSAAAAQPSAASKASAEALFDDALALMKAGSLEQACPKLEASQRIDPAVGTLLYLAECYEKTGRTASAWVTFREAAALARSMSQAPRANVAQARADRLQPELTRLTVEVSPETRALPGLRVRCGAVVLEPELYGVPVPVDPGEVRIEATAPGYQAFVLPMQIEARGRGAVAIPALLPLPASARPGTAGPESAPASSMASTAAGEASAPLPASDRADRKFPVVPIVLGSIGVVGLGVGTYFGLKAISDASDARDLCPNGKCTEQRGEDRMEDARSAATVSNVAVGLGLAAVASGVIVYWLQPGTPDTARVDVAPWVGLGTAGLAVKGAL